MQPEISVIIPTFRRPALLREAIGSALSQERVAAELVVLDDSPEGSAEEVVSELADPRVSYHRMEVPTGGVPAIVRNEGLRFARAPVLHFLDDDDRVVPGAYRAVLDALEAHPDRGVAFGRITPFGGERTEMEHEHYVFDRAARCARLYGRVPGSRALAVAHTFFTVTPLFVNSACFVRRAVADAIGGYDATVKVAEDLDFYTRAIRAFGFVFVDRPVLEYRIVAGSLMASHRPGVAGHRPAGDEGTARSARLMYSKYRAAHGAGELLALKAVGKLLLRWM
jgi:glycosyltransferase involved in cell wall biosynthesis